MPITMLNRPVNEGFSGGERKRNQLLQLTQLNPRVALLDEIDSGLDVYGVRAVVELVQRMRAQGTAFIVVSHDLPEMMNRCSPTKCCAETRAALPRQVAWSWPAALPKPALPALRLKGAGMSGYWTSPKRKPSCKPTAGLPARAKPFTACPHRP